MKNFKDLTIKQISIWDKTIQIPQQIWKHTLETSKNGIKYKIIIKNKKVINLSFELNKKRKNKSYYLDLYLNNNKNNNKKEDISLYITKKEIVKDDFDIKEIHDKKIMKKYKDIKRKEILKDIQKTSRQTYKLLNSIKFN